MCIRDSTHTHPHTPQRTAGGRGSNRMRARGACVRRGGRGGGEQAARAHTASPAPSAQHARCAGSEGRAGGW
eukprot:1563272-Rhodomonas_salina.1